MSGYTLDRVPAPPASQEWADILQWMVAVADRDHPDLSFVASLLHQALDRPGLTERQSKYAQRIYSRFHAEWGAGLLDRQRQPAPVGLADVQPAGRA